MQNTYIASREIYFSKVVREWYYIRKPIMGESVFFVTQFVKKMFITIYRIWYVQIYFMK